MLGVQHVLEIVVYRGGKGVQCHVEKKACTGDEKERAVLANKGEIFKSSNRAKAGFYNAFLACGTECN